METIKLLFENKEAKQEFIDRLVSSQDMDLVLRNYGILTSEVQEITIDVIARQEERTQIATKL